MTVNQKRVGTVVFGKRHLKDRNEEEVRCYRTALDWIHRDGPKISISRKTILKLHEMSRGEIWDAGEYKEKNVDIVENCQADEREYDLRRLKLQKHPSLWRN